jgi:hypothetical protein
MDTVGNKQAQSEIAMIKVLAPTVAQQVLDWAIQAHGAAGVSDDFPLAYQWAGNRTLRLADGPDEVHRNAIAKLELAKYLDCAFCAWQRKTRGSFAGPASSNCTLAAHGLRVAELVVQLFQRRFLPSIRTRLITLVFACALPILLGYFAFARDADRREAQHVAQDAQMIARALAAAVDRDLDNGETAARALASQPSLAAGDLAAFHAAARRVLRPEFPAYAFVLSGADGRDLLDTRHPWGTALGTSGNEADVRRVFERGDAVTSGLHRGHDAQPWVISIAVPVWREGKVAYALSVEQRPRRITELLAGQQLPERWDAQVYDNHGRLVARSGEAVRAIGSPIPAELRAALARSPSGKAILDRPGHEFFNAAYASTPAHGWTVTIGFPRHAARDLLGRCAGHDPGRHRLPAGDQPAAGLGHRRLDRARRRRPDRTRGRPRARPAAADSRTAHQGSGHGRARAAQGRGRPAAVPHPPRGAGGGPHQRAAALQRPALHRVRDRAGRPVLPRPRPARRHGQRLPGGGERDPGRRTTSAAPCPSCWASAAWRSKNPTAACWPAAGR